MLFLDKELMVTLAALLVASKAAAQHPVAPSRAKVTPVEIVLVEAETVTPAAVSQWKQERFKAVAVVLNEQTGEARYRELARHISDGGLDLYCWTEVARNPKLAAAHPRWMAALGSHEDWQKNFKNFPEPGVGEVAKAFPWVPIGYREAFEDRKSNTSELQSLAYLVCRLLLEKKKTSELQSLAYLVCRLLLEKKRRPSEYLSWECTHTYARNQPTAKLNTTAPCYACVTKVSR